MKISEKQTAIITYVDRNNQENLLNDFLPSLYEIAQYCGHVIVLEYGIDKEILDEILGKYEVEIVNCKLVTDIFVDRYRDISEVIAKLPKEISAIATMDSGDIWFQSSVSDLFINEPGVVSTVCEERIWDEDDWALKCVNMLEKSDKNTILEILSGEKVRNSGVISGERETVRKLSERVYKDINLCGYSFFGIDQIYVNYEIAMLSKEKRRLMSETFNYVLVSNVGDFTFVDGVVRRNNGDRIVVVHNAGGNWRILDRPFSNKWSNTEQYTIENVKIITSQKKEV